jgi:hypothetical protein
VVLSIEDKHAIAHKKKKKKKKKHKNSNPVQTALLVAISVPVFETHLRAINIVGICVAMVGFLLFALLTKDQLAGRVVAAEATMRDAIVLAAVADEEAAGEHELTSLVSPGADGDNDNDDDDDGLDTDIVVDGDEPFV